MSFISNSIRNKVLNETKNKNFFSFFVDETMYLSPNETHCLYLKIIFNGQIKEIFLNLFKCKEI